MPAFQDFIEQLKGIGVTIEGESILTASAAAAEDWTEEVARLALIGRKDGIRFTRVHMDCPSNEQIDMIVRGYPFKAESRSHVVANVVQADEDSKAAALNERGAPGTFLQFSSAQRHLRQRFRHN